MEKKPGQAERLYNLLKDGRPHSTIEIMERVYGNDHLGLARVGARVWDIKKKYGVKIEGKTDANKPTIYWYKLIPQGQMALL